MVDRTAVARHKAGDGDGICGWLLGSSDVWKYCYAIPLRDLVGVAVWAAGLFGNTVVWRDQRLKLDAEGRIVSNSPMFMR